MSDKNPVPMMVIYRIHPEHESEFVGLLRKHWPALRSVELATATPARIYRGDSKRSTDGKSVFIETFEWVDDKAADIAHQTPEVMSIWEPMGPMLAGMEIIALQPLDEQG